MLQSDSWLPSNKHDYFHTHSRIRNGQNPIPPLRIPFCKYFPITFHKNNPFQTHFSTNITIAFF